MADNVIISENETKNTSEEELITKLNSIAEHDIEISEVTDGLKVKLSSGIFVGEAKTIVDTICNYELEDNHIQIFLDLKGLPVETLAEIFRYAFKKEDLNDPLLILNIINLIKVYNTLDDSFFDDEYVYADDIEKFLDLKLELVDDIAEFNKKVSIYFLSLFKSYNKFVYTPMDKHYKLPTIYKNIFLSTDLLTLSGIFSDTKNFDTSECVLIEDAFLYLTSLIEKGKLSSELIEIFLKDNKNDINFQ